MDRNFASFLVLTTFVYLMGLGILAGLKGESVELFLFILWLFLGQSGRPSHGARLGLKRYPVLVADLCPDCGAFLVRKKAGRGHIKFECPNDNCPIIYIEKNYCVSKKNPAITIVREAKAPKANTPHNGHRP